VSAPSPDDARPPALPPRDPRGHKGTFGSVCVIGGHASSPRMMVGGPALSARAALRAGCGLAILAMPQPILGFALEVAPEATGVPLPCTPEGELIASGAAEAIDRARGAAHAVVIGPGLGEGEAQRQIVLRLAAFEAPPLVIDADALNALAATDRFDLDLRAKAILTPHPGEYARLAAGLGLAEDPVDPARRAAAAERLAQRVGAVVVLKGAGTIVADGLRCWTSSVGNAALATAGSGDVLAGVIASMVAQFHRAERGSASMSLYECARLGVEIHGRAADTWAATHGDAGLLARELCDLLPDVLAQMRRA